VRQVNEQADSAEDTLRLSLDAKATVNVGPFSRRGRSRTGTEGADHDFEPEAKLTPFGLLLPQYDDLSLSMTASPITADFIADRLEQWWEGNRERFPKVTKLGLLPISWSSDNGNHECVCSLGSGSVESPSIGTYLAHVAANSAGVRYPNELCGRSVLYSPFHSRPNARACTSFSNSSRPRNSSRSLLWNDSA
jgi:hypothetical protein